MAETKSTAKIEERVETVLVPQTHTERYVTLTLSVGHAEFLRRVANRGVDWSRSGVLGRAMMDIYNALRDANVHEAPNWELSIEGGDGWPTWRERK